MKHVIYASCIRYEGCSHDIHHTKRAPSKPGREALKSMWPSVQHNEALDHEDVVAYSMVKNKVIHERSVCSTCFQNEYGLCLICPSYRITEALTKP